MVSDVSFQAALCRLLAALAVGGNLVLSCTVNCDNVATDVSTGCSSVYVLDFMNLATSLGPFCTNDLECIIGCYWEKAGGCYTHPSHMGFDPTTNSAYYRGLCDDQTLTIDAFTNCQPVILAPVSQCSQALTDANNAASSAYAVDNDEAALQTAKCSAYSTLQTCIDNGIVASGPCTEQYAAFMRLSFKTRNGPSVCGSPTTWYTQFGNVAWTCPAHTTTTTACTTTTTTPATTTTTTMSTTPTTTAAGNTNNNNNNNGNGSGSTRNALHTALVILILAHVCVNFGWLNKEK